MQSLNSLVRPRERMQRIRDALHDLRATRTQTTELLLHVSESQRISRDTEQIARDTQRDLAELRRELAGSALAAEIARSSDAHRDELVALRRELAEARAASERNHERLLLALRMVRDGDDQARETLWTLRESAGYEQAFVDDEPLVSIIITTYMNWPLLRDRSLPSVLAQSYERWEAIVVGDGAPDDARRVVESFGDKRIRFVNLPYRGPYPDDPRDAWHSSGTGPWNTGLALARGSWIGANSDDDALRPNSVEALLGRARETRAEVPYGCLDARVPDVPAEKVGVFPPEAGKWGMQAALLHGGLRFLPLQPSDWVFGVPNDVSLLDRMLRIGVRFAFLDEPVVDYYPSRLWSDREERLTRRERF